MSTTGNIVAPQILHDRRRWILYAFCFAGVSLAGGIVYGWPALRRQLKVDEGSTLDESTFGAMFTTGAWSTQGGRFFTGVARDRFGTRWTACACLGGTALGALGVALSDPNNAVALACSLFALGLGSGFQLCTQPVAGLFPDHAGSILSSLSGAFQVSGLVFLALTTGSDNDTRRASFLAFVGVLLALTLAAAWLLPAGKSFEVEANKDKESLSSTHVPITTGNDGEDQESDDVVVVDESEATSLSKRNTTTNYNDEAIEDTEQQAAPQNSKSPRTTSEIVALMEEEKNKNHDQDEEETITFSRQEGNQENSTNETKIKNGEENENEKTTTTNTDSNDNGGFPSAKEQLQSYEYILLLLWFSVMLVPLQYYVGSIGFQLEAAGDDDDGFYTDLFSIIYSLSFVAAPLGGYVADRWGLGVAQGLATALCSTSLFLLAAANAPHAIISLDVHVMGLVCYGVGRMFTFGNYFANIGKRFGYAHFGTLAGLGLLTSAIASTLQYPLIAVAAQNGGRPSRTVNLVAGTALAGLLPYCAWLHRRERQGQSATYRRRRT